MGRGDGRGELPGGGVAVGDRLGRMERGRGRLWHGMGPGAGAGADRRGGAGGWAAAGGVAVLAVGRGCALCGDMGASGGAGRGGGVAADTLGRMGLLGAAWAGRADGASGVARRLAEVHTVVGRLGRNATVKRR